MNNISKIIIGIIISFVIIMSSILSALSILKEEAINNYLTISKLNAKASAKELNQDLNNIEQTMKNISSVLDFYSNDENVNNILKDIQRNYPQIRSINILSNDKIIFSSNSYNIDLLLKNIDFYPKPIFDENILKISTPWIGKDFINGNNIYNYDDEISEKESYFIPISKQIRTKNGLFNIIINLNNDYFENRFLTNIDSNDIIFELIRLDGVLLLSSDVSINIGKQIESNDLFEKAIKENKATSINTLNSTKYITTYILTNNYPIALAVKLNYEKNLMSWNKKQYNFFIITTIIIIISIAIALIFFYLYYKKREEEIKLNKLQINDQKKFKMIFQDSHFLATVINNEGEILEMNNSALDFSGLTEKTVKKEKIWNLECLRKEDKKRIKEFILSDKHSQFQGELSATNKKGEIRILDFTLSSINKNDEEILLAIALDITQRKNREEEIKQAYTIFNNTRDGILITDKDTNLLDINKAFENVTGYSKNEVLNKKINILKSNIHTKVFYENMWNNINEHGYWEGEITNLNKKGDKYTEWLTINTILDEKGEVVNYIGVFSDITEQKIKEKLLKEKNYALIQQSKLAAMGEMIGNIAHQWRQPLSVISMASTGAKLKNELNLIDNNDFIHTMDMINDSAQYLSQTIEDFRSFFDPKNSKNSEFLISLVIDKTLNLVKSQLINNNIEVVKNITDSSIVSLKNELIQVLVNIINNSIDALSVMENIDKLIFIDIKKEENSLIIAIKDNANGIKDEIIERIFEPYFTTKHQSRGTGIGLYMCEEIIKNHLNGSIQVRNEIYDYKGNSYKGAKFTIKIPV